MTKKRTIDVKLWQVFALALLVIFVVTVSLQANTLGATLTIVRRANPVWLGGAFGIFTVGLVISAWMYQVLAKHRLPFWPTLLIQIASAFAGRLLPAGSGAVAVTYSYLRQRDHTPDESIVVVAVKNSMSVVAHSVIVLGLILFGEVSLKWLHNPFGSGLAAGLLAVGVIAVIVSLSATSWRRRVQQFLRRATADVLSYRRYPGRLTGGFSLGLVYSFVSVLILFIATQMAGIDLSMADCFVILSFGVVGGAVVVTPGGLGGAEAGLLASLLAFGISFDAALVVVAVFRFVTYWVPLMVGAVAFAFAQRRGYIAYEPKRS